MKRFISMMLCMCILMTLSTCVYADTSSVRTYSSEAEARILTDEASAVIKQRIRSGEAIDIDSLLAPYFQNCERVYEYTEPSIARANSIGDTRYRVTYENSGIITYQRKYGIWKSIANATIATALGVIKSVGGILSYTYSVISGYEPDYTREAEAKTQYSYRYIKWCGQVYYNEDGVFDFHTRAMSVSREKYLHEYGYYIDSMGFAKSHTRDYEGSVETLNAPHRKDSTWLKNKAYYVWSHDLPSYYEDWND